MNPDSSASISLLSFDPSPSTSSQLPHLQRAHLSIRGRLNVPKSVGLSAFLDATPVESDREESDEDKPDDLHFDQRRKRQKSRGRRIARPRDSMPGFKKRRYGRPTRSRNSNSRFPLRGGSAVGGSRYLDRGLSSAAYYGRSADGADGDVESDNIALRQLRELEAGINDALGSDNPVCLLHGEPCIFLVCKKPGKNKGREFFKCGKKQRYEQCDFFRWVDEPPKIFSDAEESDGDDCSVSIDVPAVFDVDGDDDRSLNKILCAFGYDEFRPGQAEALRHLLDGNSTLALLPTGGGKSLIYQMFAGVRSGVVVVVTPLVSLMLDQLSRLPEELPGGCIRSGQTLQVVNATEEKLREGKIKVLFISPERLFSSRFRRLMRGQHAPKVSLVVIDEAHCISQWSHNFRTAYLRIPLALFANRRCSHDPVFKETPLLLALTATATSDTTRDICESLKIDVEESVMRCNGRRGNLKLTLSRADAGTDSKASELVNLLRREPFAGILGIAGAAESTELSRKGSLVGTSESPEAPAKKRRRKHADGQDEMIGWGSNMHVTKRIRAERKTFGKRKGSLIVYVMKQKDCASVANYLKSAVLKMHGDICMYHAGLSQKERTKVQKQFERGSVAIVVATVAFGMGLDYANVCGVIHFDMPSSLESYWQEVGRAGRGGRDAFCHVLFNEHDGFRLLSRSHSDAVDQSTVRQLIRAMVETAFEIPEKAPWTLYKSRNSGEPKDDLDYQNGQETDLDVEGKEHTAFILTAEEQKLRNGLDIKNETAETICALLESELLGLRLRKWATTKYRLKFFSKSPEDLLRSNSKALTNQDRRILDIVHSHTKQVSGHYDLDLASVSLTEEHVIGSLNRLQSGRHLSFEPLMTGLQVQCSSEAYRKLVKNIESLAGTVHARLNEIQRIRTKQAKSVVGLFSRADEMLTDIEQSRHLHNAIEKYFATDCKEGDVPQLANEIKETEDISLDEKQMEDIRSAARILAGEDRYGSTHPQKARQIARIMHGINSATFRAKDWCRNRYWGRFVEHDFEVTMRVAAEVVRGQFMSHKARPIVR